MPAFRDLPYELRLMAWLLLPAAAAMLVRKRSTPSAAAMSLTMSIAVAGAALWAKMASDYAATGGQMIADTYYVISSSPMLGTLALSYLAMAVLAQVTAGLAKGRGPWLLTLAFWLFHLAAPVALVPLASLAPIIGAPRRYVDYPAFFAKWSLASSIGSWTCLAALVLMVACFIGALIGRRAQP